ncbi:uncharacterized protein J4E87_005577 [Alternaria ethzedia]|uniref:uncharacterized protein n=1 Tax=Alternaria ethzedia TaxID=181014 RepID=UPI0020C1F622|nr:uncharacterized protein J4E87_005577 [Alternaria ethzedia]KAI4624081.1 hypothetical protein J4E87_005577 [Alternaria ethzedia]
MSHHSSLNDNTESASLPRRKKEVQTRMKDGKEVELHTWDGPQDPDNPFNWSTKYKWFLTITVCFISILTGLPAGSYGAGNEYMATLFNVQNEPFPNLYWATCSWNMGAAIFPLLFVPLTENTGRMPGYFVAYIVFELFLFGSAFADNFATLVVTRFFGGGASSVSINIVGGSISDLVLLLDPSWVAQSYSLAILPLDYNPLGDGNLGFGWAGSLLGFVGLALSLVPVVLLLKGRQIRAKSPFMSEATFDDRDDDEEVNDGKNGASHRGTFGPAGVAGGPPGAVDEHV